MVVVAVEFSLAVLFLEAIEVLVSFVFVLCGSSSGSFAWGLFAAGGAVSLVMLLLCCALEV